MLQSSLASVLTVRGRLAGGASTRACRLFFLGELQVPVLTRRVAAADELSLAYVASNKPLEARAATLATFGIACKCPLCTEQRSPAFRAKQLALLQTFVPLGTSRCDQRLSSFDAAVEVVEDALLPGSTVAERLGALVLASKLVAACNEAGQVAKARAVVQRKLRLYEEEEGEAGEMFLTSVSPFAWYDAASLAFLPDSSQERAASRAAAVRMFRRAWPEELVELVSRHAARCGDSFVCAAVLMSLR